MNHGTEERQQTRGVARDSASASGQGSAGSRWVQDVLRPVLMAAMLVCVLAPLVYMLEVMLGNWDGTFFLVFAFLAAIEGILFERALQKRGISDVAYLVSRGAEALILVIMLKFVSYVPLGLDQLWADMAMAPSDPARLLTDVDLFTAVLLVPLWAGSIWVSRLVIQLDDDAQRAEPPADKTSTEYYLWLTQPSVVGDRQAALQTLGDVFVWGGLVMLVASGLAQAFVPMDRALAIPLLLYFAIGIVFLSQARFSVTQAGWSALQIPMQTRIGRRWLVWGTVFLIGVALLALLLPTGYAMGPIRAFLGVLAFIVGIIVYLISLLFFLLTLPLAFLFPRVEKPQEPTFTPMEVGPQQQAAGSGAPPWLEAVGSALFWIILAAIVGYAGYRFFKDRLEKVDEEGADAGSWLARLLVWLRGTWRRWRQWQEEVRQERAQRRSDRVREREGPSRLSRFLSLRRLPPRELIRYFYLSTARRAEEAGQPRRRGQTPHEYQASLREQFPDLEPDLDGLTGAFVEARYSDHSIQKEDAEAVKPLWQRIKAALRRRRVGGPSQ